LGKNFYVICKLSQGNMSGVSREDATVPLPH
jgi:hypothetical protein